MKTVLIFDVETNGTDPKKDDVIEVAGALFSIEHASVVSGFSFVCKAAHNAAESVNHISPELLCAHGSEYDETWRRVAAWMKRADAIVAHNASFDRSFCPASLRDVKPWICSLEDIEWPRAGAGSRLVDIALAHGVGVCGAHRALTDVLLLASLFERASELGSALPELFAKAARPRQRYRAVTPKFDPAMNEKLKGAGFRWSPESKAWWRRLVVADVPQLVAQYPFAIAEWPE